eukprot:6690371-Ditylum_brightwellii.AAC.1
MAKKSKVQGFFVLSHGKYLNRKRANNELTQHLLMTQFDLHVNSYPAESRSVKSKLYRLNNSIEVERK